MLKSMCREINSQVQTRSAGIYSILEARGGTKASKHDATNVVPETAQVQEYSDYLMTMMVGRSVTTTTTMMMTTL